MNIVKLLIDTQAMILPGILLALVVVNLLYNMSKRSKYQRETAELEENLQVGDKVKTYAGVYGVIESISEARDGSKVVLIKTGEDNKVGYFSIAMDAIYSLDDKDEEESDEEEVEQNSEVEEATETVKEETVLNEEKPVVEEVVAEPVVEVDAEENEEVVKPKTTKKASSTTKKTSEAKKTTKKDI